MKKTAEEEILIALTADRTDRAVSIIKAEDPDYRKLLQLAAKHKLHGITAQKLLDISRQTGIELSEADITGTLQAAVAMNMQLKAGFLGVKEMLKKEQVDFLLIKGFALDPSPLRAMNDIDILIREDKIRQVFEAMTAGGYTYMGSNVMTKEEFADPFSTLHWNNQFQFRSPRVPADIEIHTELFERDRIRLERLDRFLDKAEFFWENRRYRKDLDCYIPSPEANLALLTIHCTTKRSPAHNTYILRHAYDLHALLGENRDMENIVNMERFLYLCSEWKIGYYAYTAFRLTALALDLPDILEKAELLKPLLTRRELILSNLHLNCYRGLGDASFLRRKLFALFMPFAIGGSVKKGVSWYRKILFPPAWYQEERYGIKRSSPFFFLSYIYGPFVFLWRRLTGLSE